MNLYQNKVQKKGKEAQVANHDNKEYLAAENGETKQESPSPLMKQGERRQV